MFEVILVLLYNGGMKTVQSRLKVLVAEKELRERRRIGLRVIARETGASLPTIQRLMNNTIKRIPIEDLGALCRWLECEVGDMLYMAEDISDKWANPPAR